MDTASHPVIHRYVFLFQRKKKFSISFYKKVIIATVCIPSHAQEFLTISGVAISTNNEELLATSESAYVTAHHTMLNVAATRHISGMGFNLMPFYQF